MKIEELSEILSNMYENAPENEQVVNIHLFGIKYGEMIRSNNYRVSKIIELAEMKKSYTVEVSKGIKLSQYVRLNNNSNK